MAVDDGMPEDGIMTASTAMSFDVGVIRTWLASLLVPGEQKDDLYSQPTLRFYKLIH